MLQMTLYNYSGDRRQLNKYLTTIDTVDIIAITNDTNILKPTIIINTRAFNFNYVYVPAWSRYYYVDNIQLLGGERIAMDLTVDVLMSHKSAILSSQVMADRSTSNSNPYIIDTKVQSSDKAKVYVRNMAVTPFNPGAGTYILTVGGK